MDSLTGDYRGHGGSHEEGDSKVVAGMTHPCRADVA